MLVTVVSILAALLFCGLICLILAAIAHNRLQGSLARCTNAFRQLDRHLQQRSQLIVQLVENLDVSGAGDRGTWETIVEQCKSVDVLRQKVSEKFGDQETLINWTRAEQELDAALVPVLENAPPSSASESATDVANWADAWNSTLGRISFAREALHDFAEDYNHSRSQFLTRLFASRLGFAALPLLPTTGEPHTR